MEERGEKDGTEEGINVMELFLSLQPKQLCSHLILFYMYALNNGIWIPPFLQAIIPNLFIFLYKYFLGKVIDTTLLNLPLKFLSCILSFFFFVIHNF